MVEFGHGYSSRLEKMKKEEKEEEEEEEDGTRFKIFSY